MKRILHIIFLLSLTLALNAQYQIRDNLLAGSNTVSGGFFLRNDLLAAYSDSLFTLTGGFQLCFDQSEQQVFSGWTFQAGTKLPVRSFPLNLELYYLKNPYSSLTKEHNFGILISHRWPHFFVSLGNGTRIWSLNRKLVDESDLPEGTDYNITEYRNLLYRFTYLLFDDDSDWNLSLSLTDYDIFLIQQETNPLLNLSFSIKPAENLSLLAEVWYQGSGMLNLQADYYGYYFKAGAIWEF